MNRKLAGFIGRIALLGLILGSLVAGSVGHAAAQDSYQAGWYDANGDGCLYYYDGYGYTGDSDCSGQSSSSSGGYAAGWYDANGDGCLYYFDGYEYTGDSDCSGQTS